MICRSHHINDQRELLPKPRTLLLLSSPPTQGSRSEATTDKADRASGVPPTKRVTRRPEQKPIGSEATHDQGAYRERPERITDVRAGRSHATASCVRGREGDEVGHEVTGAERTP
jgi:hypothetical protein